ncbi:MAG: hypothetical protein WCJ09_04305 [Planctomycetota bacterium]
MSNFLRLNDATKVLGLSLRGANGGIAGHLLNASIVFVILLASGLSFADDAPKVDPAPVKDLEKAKESDTEPEKPSAPDKVKKPANPSILDKVSKELFKDLDEGAAEKEKENKLDRITKGMRNAGEKLDGDETGEETRKVQKQVIKDLDDLINQLQNPPPSGGGGGGGGGASSRAGKSGQGQMQKMQAKGQLGKSEQAKGQMGSQNAQLNKSGGKDRKDAQGSDERTDSERKAAEEEARKKKLEMDVWGHLPPHMREQLLNTYGERMLPKYQQLVKQFYESLSEQSNPPPRR